MKEYTCVECGAKFQANQQAKYCCPACKSRHSNKANAVFQCVYCGKQFSARRISKARFCSKECMVKTREAIKADPTCELSKYMKVKTEKTTYKRWCIDCGKQFDTLSSKTMNRRCPECLAIYKKNWHLLDKPGLLEKLEDGPCTEQKLDRALELAGVEVHVGAAQDNKAQTYLPMTQTREERNARRRALRAKKKALGLLKPEGDAGRDRTGYRKRTLERCGKYCSVCGYSEHEEALHAHHVDMNRDNNADDNLVVVCANCHTYLHTLIRRNWASYEDKRLGIIKEYLSMAEVKERNKAGTPGTGTRTEGCEESQSGATHSGTSRPDMSHHEAAPLEVVPSELF